MDHLSQERLFAESMATAASQIQAIDNPQMRGFLTSMASMRNGEVAGRNFNRAFESFEQGPMAQANAVAKALRTDWHKFNKRAMPSASEVMSKADFEGSVMKSTMDVGFLTDLAALTGGQSLGLVSMDTRVMRGTVRPNSFTLYNVLKKTRANQMVDFWTTAYSVGGNLPGSAYTATSNQTNGSIAPNNGTYGNNFCTLKMLVDGRALTVALAAQSSFLDIAEQESANGAINLLSSMNWSIYWGNPTLYPTQPAGLASLIPASNVVNFQEAYAASSQTLSQQQFLYDLVYQQAGFIDGTQFGTTTHVFGTPTTMGDLQSLVTMNLSQFISNPGNGTTPIVINGDFQGMRTRFGDIQFPMDLFIDFRDRPAASIVNQLTNAPITVTTVNAPTSVTPTVQTAVAGSNFTTGNGYVGTYTYAVAAADSAMNESGLTFSSAVTTLANGGSVTLAIAPNGTAATAFRIYRSGLGYTGTNASSFRLIGEVAATGATTVNFVDLNTKIPGSQTLFLLDLDDGHDAIDYRWLLPITKVDLFAQNMYMPWAITHIGTPRIKMPKWHGMITNYIPASPQWNPLQPNTGATTRFAT